MDVTELTPDDLIVDLSSHNSVVNYAAMKDANSSGWSKATQGGGYTNPLFTTQMTGMKAAGMVPGAYHFPDNNVSVVNNVSHFVSVAGKWITDGCLVPLLDVENDFADGVQWTQASANTFIPSFIAELRRRVEMPDLVVVVYGSDSWWGTTLRPDTWGDLSRVILMDAMYDGVPGQTKFKHARLGVHQYTDAALTPGVQAPTDRSVIMPGFSLSDLTIGYKVPTPQEEDDDMAQNPVLFKAEGYVGVWRDEFGNYFKLNSENDISDLLDAFPETNQGTKKSGVWVETATLDGFLGISTTEV